MKLFHILFGFDGQSWYFSLQRFPPQRPDWRVIYCIFPEATFSTFFVSRFFYILQNTSLKAWCRTIKS